MSTDRVRVSKVKIAINLKVLFRERPRKTRKISSVSGTSPLCSDQKVYLFIPHRAQTRLKILTVYQFRPTFRPSSGQYINQFMKKKPYSTAHINLGMRYILQVNIRTSDTVWIFRNL